MTRILRTASVALLLTTAGLAVAGCTVQTAKGVTGTPSTGGVDWSSGQDILIELPSAAVRIGDASTAITVVPGGGTQVIAKFTPFNSAAGMDKQKATDEINNNLHMAAENAGGVVHIYATTSGTHSNSLSAFVDITLPAGFNGRIIAKPGNGDVSIQGAPAGVEVDTSLGNVAVQFTSPLRSTDTGHVISDQGDITFDIPGSSDIAFTAQSGAMGGVILPAPLPSGWVASPNNMPTSASFTANAGSASPWKLDSSGFFTSKVEVRVH